ncbi:tRNA (guanosine(37)-N1)-methyltransferase TrmD [Atopobium fossor]|uniref:tRNA (guanosine(37)-N1)-methyltransferase TrmD n=1 Tax=Atopobium fossor TaxID=39487 RepID=UPI00040D9E79|nr:tRNA (guanosine(37)-N1)-methyltransferase TrmD [Atopobium fossor]
MRYSYEAISVFPEVFDAYFGSSILGKAQDRGIFSFTAHNLRDWTHDRHKTVDDAPFGGGAGMLMKPAPIFEAFDAISAASNEKPYVVFFTPTGTPFTQQVAERLSKKPRIVFMCGRYEGIDQRAYSLADEELSLGDYVLTGGELACMVVVDAIVRLLPGALGDEMSAQDESFSAGLLEYEQYTRPSSYRGMNVPEVLLSGNHGKIASWRRANALERTVLRRPDLLEQATLSKEEELFVQQLLNTRIKENDES